MRKKIHRLSPDSMNWNTHENKRMHAWVFYENDEMTFIFDFLFTNLLSRVFSKLELNL